MVLQYSTFVQRECCLEQTLWGALHYSTEKEMIALLLKPISSSFNWMLKVDISVSLISQVTEIISKSFSILRDEGGSETISNAIIFSSQAHRRKTLPRDVSCFVSSQINCRLFLLFYAEWKLKWWVADKKCPAEARGTIQLHCTDHRWQHHRLCPPGRQG